MQIVGYVYIQAAAATLSRRRDLHSEELWNAVRTSRTCNGAVQGIGLEISRLLIANRARVAMVDLQSDLLGAAAAAIGESAASFPADLADVVAIEDLVRQGRIGSAGLTFL